jgi:hypothetical protein
MVPEPSETVLKLVEEGFIIKETFQWLLTLKP